MDVWVSRRLGSSFSFSHASVGPAAHLQYRYYYNYAKRTAKKLRTELNSLNYIAPSFSVSNLRPVKGGNRNWITQTGVLWGIQRNYASRFSLDLSLGLAYLSGASGVSNNNKINPAGNFSLGFWLKKGN